MGLHIMAANHVERSCLVNLHTTMIRLPAGSRGDRGQFSLVPMLALGQETATWPPLPNWPSARELQRPKSCQFSSTTPDVVDAILDGKQGPEVTLARLIGAFVVKWARLEVQFGAKERCFRQRPAHSVQEFDGAGLQPFLTLPDLHPHTLAFNQPAQPGARKCRRVYEDIFPTVGLADKAEPLIGLVHLDGADTFARRANDLRRTGRTSLRRFTRNWIVWLNAG